MLVKFLFELEDVFFLTFSYISTVQLNKQTTVKSAYYEKTAEKC